MVCVERPIQMQQPYEYLDLASSSPLFFATCTNVMHGQTYESVKNKA